MAQKQITALECICVGAHVFPSPTVFVIHSHPELDYYRTGLHIETQRRPRPINDMKLPV